MFLVFNQATSSRLGVISRSSVPQAIQSKWICRLSAVFRRGNALAKSLPSPPALKDPIYENLSSRLSPVSKDSAPPIDSPAIARESRLVETLYIASTAGMTSSIRASRKLLKFLSRRTVLLKGEPDLGAGCTISGAP